MLKKFEDFNSNSGLKKEDFYWEAKFDVIHHKLLTMGDDYRYDTGEEFKRISFTQDEILQIDSTNFVSIYISEERYQNKSNY